MSERSRRLGKRIGCGVIVCAAAVTLGLGVYHDLQLTAAANTPESIMNATGNFQQDECIYRAIRSEVPKGATVYGMSNDFVLRQRLAGLSTLWAVPQPSPATARWILTLVPAHGDCVGLALKVRRT